MIPFQASGSLVALLAISWLSGCASGEADSTMKGEAAAVAAEPIPPPTGAAGLPAAIEVDLRKDFVVEGAETRYVMATHDLNGDGNDEYIVYLLGPMACGTGGCSTLVYTPSGDGYARIGEISVSRTPIRVAPRSTDGWADLIVGIGGGGGESGNAEVMHGPDGYNANPTGSSARIVTDLSGTTTLIAEADFTSGMPLTPAGAP